jgi:hypothetical protein
MTPKELAAGLVALSKSPTPEYLAVMQRWEGFSHTVRINGKWRLQGFITWLMHSPELCRCVDPSLPPFPALHLFTPKVIAHLLSIPPEEVGCRSGKIGKPGRPQTTRDIAEFGNDRLPNMTWKEIATEWKRLHKQETRDITADKMKDAHRRAYRLLRKQGRH